MERLYDLFEVPARGSRIWRGSVMGLAAAVRELKELARRTTNECLAMHIPTRQVVAIENIPKKAGGQPAKRLVVQIAYDERLLAERAEVLRREGYEVVSLLGNERAEASLITRPRCDFFILGHGAPEAVRKEIVAWLKTEYPKTKILALNPRNSPRLAGADYNIELNGPETWLPLVAAAIA